MTQRPKDQAKWGRTLRRWYQAEMDAPTMQLALPPYEVWRSRDFLVQLFREPSGVRMSVNRTHMPNGKDWAEGISWDDLQRLKYEIGRGDLWAVELYPADEHVVDDANMRHLWLLGEPPSFGWRQRDANVQG